MSGLALVFFTVISLQAVSNAAVIQNENDTPRETLQKILQISESICESLQNAQAAHIVFAKNGYLNLDEQFEDVVASLEKTAAEYDTKIQNAVLRLSQGLVRIQTNWNALRDNTDIHAVRTLMVSLLQNAQKLESWKEIIEEQPFDYHFWREIQPTLTKTVEILKTLNGFICNKRFCKSREEVAKYRGYSFNTMDQFKQFFSKSLEGLRTKREAKTTQIKNAVNDIVKYVLSITSEDYEIKRDLMLYIRNLIETLISVIDVLEDDENATLSQGYQTIIEDLRNAKLDLQEVYTSSIFYDVAQLKVELTSRIKKVVAEIEQLAEGASQQVSQEFLSYLNGVKKHISDVIEGRPLEGYRSKVDGSKKPWGYVRRITNNFTITDF